ncbi:MAG TPA: type IV pilus secretin PilQ [Candidatus Binatia bacterium]|nr:type IV pilus secretin PilQ [Candidatus Binatia bacterium]
MAKARNSLMDRLAIWIVKCTWTPMMRALLAAPIGFVITITGCSVSVDKEQQKPPPATISTAAQSAPGAKSALPTAAPKEPSTAGQALSLQDLSVREERGQTTLLVKFSQPVTQYRHFPLQQPSRIVLDIFSDAKQPAAAESFRIDTHWVGTLRLSSREGIVRLVADIAAASIPPYTITSEEGGLKIIIGSFDPNATAKKNVTLVTAGVRGDVRTAEAPSTTGAKSTGRASASDEIPADEKQYTGQKISLEFKDADIKNVFRLLAEVSGRNLVVTDDVNRRVTVRLIEVPWDQALDLIIKTNGLDKEEVGNVIRISTAGRLKADRDQLAASKKAGENYEELQTAYIAVNYARVTRGKDDSGTGKDLLEMVKAVLTPRGKIEADQRTNTLIVRDIKKGIEDVQNLVSRLDTRTAQVLIESNLIETTPTFSRALGVEMEALFRGGRVRTSTRFRADPPFDGAPQPTPETNQLIIPTTGFRFGYFGNNITSILSAAEAQGNVKIISRPSVVTLNNVESQIESANIIRIRTSAATVGEAGTLREIRAGITLKVTPQVSADGFVLLTIMAKSSTLDFGRTVEGIPQENSREAKANVLVKDGETVVIGGIMKDNSSASETGIPYLKDIPVIGWLFKKSSWQKDFEELVVFITPRIIAAGSENLPTAEQLWRDQLKQTEGSAPLNTSPKP